MKNISRYKVENGIVIPLIIFSVISIISIYSAEKLLPAYMNGLYIKQSIWYIFGFIIAFALMSLGNNFIYKNIWILYWLGIASLMALLIFGVPINGAKCWFVIPYIGSIQPSEFMKIILIIVLARVINEFNGDYKEATIKEEFKLLVKVAIIVGIPSVLTFLQPDTGLVIIYLIITMIMLFVSGIRYGWFVLIFGLGLLIGGSVVGIYFLNHDLFINLFGTNLFYRLDRVFDWSSGSGMQLRNAITAIGSAGFLGNGFAKTPVYFPAPHTDFIFAIFASNFGFLGIIVLLSLFLFFNLKLISLANKDIDNINKYIIAGIVGMLIYQQFQNIGMTIGLMPINGITLPFISYGGSSLLSYMIIAGIIFNISNESLRFTN
ncbi:MAG: FtsW/RodA/SpoVE family cell cycle protein [Bacilli bacterium]|nr:FtsW/RodA/SpoVE family cell cycle protein [Bacilli bacterium]